MMRRLPVLMLLVLATAACGGVEDFPEADAYASEVQRLANGAVDGGYSAQSVDSDGDRAPGNEEKVLSTTDPIPGKLWILGNIQPAGSTTDPIPGRDPLRRRVVQGGANSTTDPIPGRDPTAPYELR